MLRVRSKRLNRTVPLTDIKFRFGGIVEDTIDNEYFEPPSTRAMYNALIGYMFNTKTDPFQIKNADAEQIVDIIPSDPSGSNPNQLFFEYFFGLFSPVYQQKVPVNDNFNFNRIELYNNDVSDLDVKIYRFSRLFKIYTFDIRGINIDNDTRIIRPTSPFRETNKNAVHTYVFDPNERMSDYRDVLRSTFGKLFERTRSIEHHFNAITKAYYPLSMYNEDRACDRKDLIFLGDEDAYFDYIGTYILYIDNGNYKNIKWKGKRIGNELLEVYRAFDSFTNAKLNYLKVRRLLLVRANILFQCFGIGVQLTLPDRKDTKELTAEYYRRFAKTIFETTILYENRQNFIRKLYTNLFVNTKQIKFVQRLYNVSDIQPIEYEEILNLTQSELEASTDVTNWENVKVLDYTFDKAHEQRFQELKNNAMRIQNLTDEIENLKSQLENPSLNEKEIDDLKKTIQACESNLSERNRRINEIQKNVDSKDQKINELSDRVRKTKTELDEALLEKDEEISSLRYEISGINDNIEEGNERITELLAQVEEREIQIGTLRENNEKMGHEIETLTDLIRDKDIQIERLNKNEVDIGTTTEEELRKKNKDIKQLNQDINQLRIKMENDINDINEMNKIITGNKVLIRDLERQIEDLKSEITDYSNNIEILNKQIVSLEKVNTDLTTQVNSQRTEIATLNTSNVNLREQFDNKNEETNRLRSANTELTSQISSQKSVIDKLETRSSTATNVINALRQSNTATERDKNNLLTELNKYDATINDRDNTIGELLDKNKSLSEKITRLEDELNTLNNQYAASLRTPENNDNIVHFESLITSKDDEIVQCKTDLASLERKNTLAQNENANLKQNNINLEGKIRSLENLNNKLKEGDNISQDNYNERIRDLERENERLRIQAMSDNQSTPQIDQVSVNQINKLEQDKQRLEEELREANRIVTSSRAITHNIEEENRALRQRLEEDTRYERHASSEEAFVRRLIENAYLPNTAMALDSLRKSLASQFVNF